MHKLFLFHLCIFSTLCWSQISYPGLEGITWKTGQVIGISEIKFDPSTFVFEAGTGSRYGHVGIVSIEGSKVFVYEATPPIAKKTSLKAFLSKANKNALGKLDATVVEPTSPLSSKENESFVNEMKSTVRKKVPYNFSVIINEDSMNCSEFVYKMYQKIGKQAGEIELFSQMNLDGFKGQLINFFGAASNISPESKMITPVSIINSPLFKVIKANLPVNKLISEFEVFSIWKNAGGLDALAKLFDLQIDDLLQLESLASKNSYRVYPSTWRK